jgi:hypothetical protein
VFGGEIEQPLTHRDDVTHTGISAKRDVSTAAENRATVPAAGGGETDASCFAMSRRGTTSLRRVTWLGITPKYLRV